MAGGEGISINVPPAGIGELARQNPWWDTPGAINADPKIQDLDAAPLKWRPRIRRYMDLNKDVLYSVRGPRQVGKTTFVKMIIREELEIRNPADIFYYTCDLVSGARELKDILETFITWSNRQSPGRKLICLDEITRVKDWESGYKQIIDTYSIRNCTYILTASSSWDLGHGVERLPGRKGEGTGEQNHKILLPQKFAEYVGLRNGRIGGVMEMLGLGDNSERMGAFRDLMTRRANTWIDPLLPFSVELDALFEEYLMTGGIMAPTNQLASSRRISNSTYELYLQMFFGDVAKMQRDEGTARKVVGSILRHSSSLVGWQRIAVENSLTAVTVENYAEILQNLFVLNIYHAFDQGRKRAKVKSEKKLRIPNPFFFHAFRGYIENPAGDYFRQAQAFLMQSDGKASLAESVVGDHLARLAYNHHPSDLFDQSNSVFYVRNNKGETVDFVVRLPDGFVPVEVKYQNSISASDSRSIRKFERGVLATKSHLDLGTSHPAIPIPLLLLFV